MFTNHLKASDLFFGRPAQHFLSGTTDEGFDSCIGSSHSISSTKDHSQALCSQDLFSQAQSETEIQNSAYDKYMALKIPEIPSHGSKMPSRDISMDVDVRNSKEQAFGAECKSQLAGLKKDVQILTTSIGEIKANVDKLITLHERGQSSQFLAERESKEILTKSFQELGMKMEKSNRAVENCEKQCLSLQEILKEMFDKFSSHIIKQSEELTSNMVAVIKHENKDLSAFQVTIETFVHNVIHQMNSEKMDFQQFTNDISRGIQLLLEEFRNSEIVDALSRKLQQFMNDLGKIVTDQLHELKNTSLQFAGTRNCQNVSCGASTRCPNFSSRLESDSQGGQQMPQGFGFMRNQNNSNFSFEQGQSYLPNYSGNSQVIPRLSDNTKNNFVILRKQSAFNMQPSLNISKVGVSSVLPHCETIFRYQNMGNGISRPLFKDPTNRASPFFRNTLSSNLNNISLSTSRESIFQKENRESTPNTMATAKKDLQSGLLHANNSRFPGKENICPPAQVRSNDSGTPKFRSHNTRIDSPIVRARQLMVNPILNKSKPPACEALNSTKLSESMSIDDEKDLFPKLSDFSMAKPLTSKYFQDTNIASKSILSPEQKMELSGHDNSGSTVKSPTSPSISLQEDVKTGPVFMKRKQPYYFRKHKNVDYTSPKSHHGRRAAKKKKCKNRSPASGNRKFLKECKKMETSSDDENDCENSSSNVESSVEIIYVD